LADVDQGRRGKRSQAFLGGWWRHRHGKNTTIPETVAEGRERLLEKTKIYRNSRTM